MSANFWCWLPALGLLPASPNFLHRVDELHRMALQPVAPAIVQFVDGLLQRYPDLSETKTDTAWPDGPMLNDANGKFIDFSIRWDYYERAAPFVVKTARRFKLSCYDPQTAQFYPAQK